MCGIAGLINAGRRPATETIIKLMTDRMQHRGPDADGFYLNGPLALGHRRLSIIDLSERSNQPLFDASGRYAIVFNGEIYNYLEVKNSLPAFPFKTAGDTEVALAAYLTWGIPGLDRLKGMFAFAIYDSVTEELFITRDRLGIKPVYYYQDDQVFLFASEIRALLASGLVPRKLNHSALADYFSYQSFQSPDTIVANVKELEAGCCLSWKAGVLTQVRYWDVAAPVSIELEKETTETIQKKVRSLLLQSVERRMVSDVPVAAFLSGGIDSSAIVGLMAEISNAPETFTIAFEEKAYDESEYAALLAKKFNTRHHNILVKPERFLHDLPAALNAMDSPSGDGINTYVVSKAIRQQGIKVALSGVGGDELFAGYPLFRQWASIYQKKAFFQLPMAVRKLLAGAIQSRDIRRQRVAQLLRLKKCDIAHVYPILRQVNAEANIQTLLAETPGESRLFRKLQGRQHLSGFPLYSQVSIAEYLGYTSHTLLKDTDQMSMANSLEVREPFFDHELIEYVLQVPDRFKQGSMPKALLIQSLGGLVPEAIYQRPKKGFVFPWSQWFRGELRQYCESRIGQLAQRSFMQAATVKQTWTDFLEGKHQVGWTNILLLVALENYIEQQQLQ